MQKFIFKKWNLWHQWMFGPSLWPMDFWLCENLAHTGLDLPQYSPVQTGILVPKKEIFVVVWVHFDWDEWILPLSATNGFLALSRTDEFRLCLEPVDIPVRRYWIFAFGWKEWICVIGFASKPGPIDFRICPGSVNFYNSNWESIHTATTH